MSREKGTFLAPFVSQASLQGEEIAELKKIGVRDSKVIGDKEIFVIARQLRERFATYAIRINPPKYNELYSRFRNLNRLLAWGHATAIEALVAKTGCHDVIIDQFAAEHVVETALKKKGISLNLTQRTKAEEDPVVAAASIIARASFLEGLEKLGESNGFLFPKGAGPEVLKAGKRFLEQFGEVVLGQVCKGHFKTLDQILGKKENLRKVFGSDKMRQTVLAILVTVLVGVLLFLHYAAPVLTTSLIDLSSIDGVDVYHKGVPYTLNLGQQNALGGLVNSSLNVTTAPSLEPNTIDVEKVIIYVLKEPKNLVLIPKGENSVHFTYYSLDGKIYKEPQPGKLKELLESTYDH